MQKIATQAPASTTAKLFAEVGQVYLNGEFLLPAQAKVSVFDRGFIFGDGVYEVIPVFGGRLFRLEHHLKRLDQSLKEIKLKNPYSTAQWQTILARLSAQHGTSDQSIYLQITRGVAPRDHSFPVNTVATVFAYAQRAKYPSAVELAAGVAAITIADIRWQRCDIKAIALLANALLRSQATDQGAAEAVLLRDGFVTEGAASNIFVVSRGRIVTPPKGPTILPGITRDLVLELARTHSIPWAEENIAETALRSADEIWMTSSMREVMPITKLDREPVGTGRPGPVHARIYALYQAYKQAFCQGKPA